MAQEEANDSGHDVVVPTHSNLQLSQFQRDLPFWLDFLWWNCEGLKPPLESFSRIDHAVIVRSNNY